MDMISIGKNLKRYRTDKGIKQDELAEKTHLSANYIGMIERGEKKPSLSSLIKIVNALGITADMVLCDVLTETYNVRSSAMIDKICALPSEEQQRIYAVIETLIQFAE